MPRGRPKKTSNKTTSKPTKPTKIVKKVVPQTYNALDFEHTGIAKFNPRNLFEEWGLADLHKEDSKIDKKLYKKVKKATPRRPAVEEVTVTCPFCKKRVAILENDFGNYNYSIPNDSMLPTFKCDKCSGN